jgi:hypothetical protein
VPDWPNRQEESKTARIDRARFFIPGFIAIKIIPVIVAVKHATSRKSAE